MNISILNSRIKPEVLYTNLTSTCVQNMLKILTGIQIPNSQTFCVYPIRKTALSCKCNTTQTERNIANSLMICQQTSAQAYAKHCHLIVTYHAVKYAQQYRLAYPAHIYVGQLFACNAFAHIIFRRVCISILPCEHSDISNLSVAWIWHVILCFKGQETSYTNMATF